MQTIPQQNISVKHSGPSGDVLYSLPTAKKLAETYGPIDYYLHAGMLAHYYDGAKHPDGNVALTQKRVEMFIPLLESQWYIKKAALWTGEKVVIDLDWHLSFESGKPYGDIRRWYFHIWPELTCNLALPTLEVEPIPVDGIVVNRTERYRNPKISYQFLQHLPDKIYFLGTLEELALFRIEVPKAEFLPCDNFLLTAQYIAGSKLFIGNQSMCFAIAEGLKVPRVLEAAKGEFNNVIPTGEKAYDFFVQSNFQTIVNMLVC
jgi:hypothetical protein